MAVAGQSSDTMRRAAHTATGREIIHVTATVGLLDWRLRVLVKACVGAASAWLEALGSSLIGYDGDETGYGGL